MTNLLRSLWTDEAGFIVSSELALVSTLGVLGMTAGLSQAVGGVNGELHDVGSAFSAMDQSYSINSASGQVVQYLDGDQPR